MTSTFFLPGLVSASAKVIPCSARLTEKALASGGSPSSNLTFFGCTTLSIEANGMAEASECDRVPQASAMAPASSSGTIRRELMTDLVERDGDGASGRPLTHPMTRKLSTA